MKNWVDVIKRDLRQMDLNWRMTKQNGVDVWPNAAIWMRDKLRLKKITFLIFCRKFYRDCKSQNVLN